MFLYPQLGSLSLTRLLSRRSHTSLRVITAGRLFVCPPRRRPRHSTRRSKRCSWRGPLQQPSHVVVSSIWATPKCRKIPDSTDASTVGRVHHTSGCSDTSIPTRMSQTLIAFVSEILSSRFRARTLHPHITGQWPRSVRTVLGEHGRSTVGTCSYPLRTRLCVRQAHLSI
jgi:hypothetical protein